MSARSVAVFDIDGVVADVRHRLHHLAGPHKNWGGFFSSAATDPPLETGIELVTKLHVQHEIVWLTGRPEWLRSVTETWLCGQGLPAGELYLRPTNDHRPARLYKLGVLRRIAKAANAAGTVIAAFIDDDDEVIDAALAAGFPAVLADWLPRAAALREAQDRYGRS